MTDLIELITTLKYPELGTALADYAEKLLPEFEQVLREHPLQDSGSGRCSISEAFWLYGFVKSLRPDVVIESGTLQGYSLYFLRRGSPANARLISFDPNTREEFRRHADVEYFRSDWLAQDLPPLSADRTVVFFDDHQDQGRRLAESRARGIRHVIFHDNYLTPNESHVSIRFCSLFGRARFVYVFQPLTCSPLFTDTSVNPQHFRWLTYVMAEDMRPLLRLLWNRVVLPFRRRSCNVR